MPPTLPEFDPTDPALQILLQWYDRMEGTLIETLRDATVQGWEREYAAQMLRGMDLEIRRLEKSAQAWDASYLREQYITGQVYADGLLREIEGMPFDFIDEPLTPPREALSALAQDAAGQRDKLLTAILRQSDDYLRGLASGEIAEGLGLGRSSYAVGKAIREGLIASVRTGAVQQELARGIMTASGVVYSDGSVHSLHAYGQMAGRTGMAQALRVGQLNRFSTTGLVHVVKIPFTGTLCFLCAPTEGRCYAIDAEGERLGYPPIAAWYATGAGHPSCRHTAFSPVVFPDPRTDLPPDRWTLTAEKSELYHRFRDEHPELYQASRQGFATTGELAQWRKANPDVPFEELRGPRFRYQRIESRRQAAVEEILQNPDLSYADAMSRQTESFMAGEDYQAQRPEKTPAAQARAVQAAR
ncbi:MAG: hypothetical protein ACYDCO_26525 [Armatimonadota bacterium]